MVKKLILLVFLSLITFNVVASCRSSSVKKQFDRINGYTKGRIGYVVDHICPLVCGGLDDVKNMQYQTVLEGKKKDKWETTPFGCSTTCNSTNSLPRRTVFNCK